VLKVTPNVMFGVAVVPSTPKALTSRDLPTPREGRKKFAGKYPEPEAEGPMYCAEVKEANEDPTAVFAASASVCVPVVQDMVTPV
jgi:hypothetical protein